MVPLTEDSVSMQIINGTYPKGMPIACGQIPRAAK